MKISFWDAHTLATVRSERDYDEHTITTHDGDVGPDYAKNVTFFTDMETGLVVSDIRRYEAWLRSLTAGTNRPPLDVGDILEGYCGGVWGRDNYGPNRLVSIVVSDGRRIFVFDNGRTLSDTELAEAIQYADAIIRVNDPATAG